MLKAKIAAAVIVSAAVAPGLAFIGAAKAVASPENPNLRELAYVKVLAEKGYSAGSVYATITAGYEICGLLSTGLTDLEVAQILYGRTDYSIDAYDAGYIVGAAHQALCPGIGQTAVA